MNLIRKIIGQSTTDELASIPLGKLFLTRRPDSPKGEFECLFNDAYALIKKTDVSYTLCVTRVYSEGEENSPGGESDNDDDSPYIDEWKFPLTEELNISLKSLLASSSGSFSGSFSISWSHLDGDLGDNFQFIADTSVKQLVFDTFTLCIYRCLYEQRYRLSANGVPLQELIDEFEVKLENRLWSTSSREVFDDYTKSKLGVSKPSRDIDDFKSNNLRQKSRQLRRESSDFDDFDEKSTKFNTNSDPLNINNSTSNSTTKTKKSNSSANTTSKVIEVNTDSDDEFEDALVGTTLEPIGKVIYSSESFSLHLFDSESGTFKIQAEPSNVELKIFDLGNWEYTLFVCEINSKNEDPILINATITQNMSPTFNYQHSSFIFNHYLVAASNELSGFSWLLKFTGFSQLQVFQSIFMQSMWEALHKMKYSIPKSDEEYLAETFKSISLTDDVQDEIDELTEREEEDERDSENDDKPRSLRRKAKTLFVSQDLGDEYGDDQDEREQRQFETEDEKNSGLAIGSVYDRTYVARGDKLGVFGTDSGLSFKTTISDMKDLKGKKFVPKKTLLHQADQYMIMSNQSDPNALYKMDLTRGKIVEEWNIDDENPIVSFAPNTKYSQTTNEQTLTGIHSNGLFKIDPRLSGKKLVNDNTYKTYKTKTQFSTISTTEQGYLALGSKDGAIRLYDKTGGNAKSTLPSFGSPITGTDVSNDGRWLLATCDTHLLLIDLKIGEDNKNAGSLGYNKYFDKDKKPTPRRLALRPEHAAFITSKIGKSLKFTVAHFNKGLNLKESTLVTSCGPYIISWSLRKVLKGDVDSYVVKEYQSTVVADNFVFGSNNELIYALEDDVSMTSRKKLLEANKVLSATSRDSIVKKY